MSRPRHVVVVAGEASGDQHAAGLVREARALDPQLTFEGIGSSALAAQGVKLLHDARELGVVGIVEVFEKLPALRKALNDVKRAVLEGKPDGLLLIDFPDFNLRLARHAARAGVPVTYFISPQLWAWREGRVARIKRDVRRMVVLFPFEEEFYRRHGVPVVFSGHPLAEGIGERVPPPEARRRLGLDPDAPVYGLLPGSRGGELRLHLEPLLDTAREVLKDEPRAVFLIPVAPTLDPAAITGPAAASGLPVVALGGAFGPLVDACDAAVCASGTATLELAVRGVPPVVVYRTSALTYAIGRMVVKVPWVSLVNLVAGRELVPELIQHDFTPAKAAAELLALGRPGARRTAVLDGLAGVRARLGPPGAYRRAAEALLATLDEGPPRRGESTP